MYNQLYNPFENRIREQYDYTQRCTGCDTLIGQDIPFTDEPTNYLCDNCYELACTSQLFVVTDTGEVESIDVNPFSVDTPDKLAAYVKDFEQTLKYVNNRPQLYIVMSKVYA